MTWYKEVVCRLSCSIFSPLKFMAYHSTRFNRLNPTFPEQRAPPDITGFYSPGEPVLRQVCIMLPLRSAGGGDAGPRNSRRHTIKLQVRSSSRVNRRISQVNRRINLVDNWELQNRAWRCTKGRWNPISMQSPASKIPCSLPVGWAASGTKALTDHLTCSPSKETIS